MTISLGAVKSKKKTLDYQIDKLKSAEILSNICGKDMELRAYKLIGRTLIRCDKPLREVYRNNLKYSELQFFPKINYKIWGNWLLSKLRRGKSDIKIHKFLGVALCWYFKKRVFLPLQADIIYYRKEVILIYSSVADKQVIKIALTNRGEKLLLDEVRSQRIANSIKKRKVFIPRILKEVHEEGLNFSVEEYFEGQRLSFKDTKKLHTSYHQVFNFLKRFYLKNPIELRPLSENTFLGHDFVDNFIRQQPLGEKVGAIFRKLYSKNKKIILCRIHGDLSHNNILVRKDGVCIIDWGKSEQNYLALDLDNSSYDTQSIYNEFIKEANIDTRNIYSYQEQIFLTRYIKMNRFIYNKIKRNKVTTHFRSWVKKQNRVLVKMEEELEIH